MGPLKGYKIIEIGAIGPGPFCAMMLSDMGAEVLRLDRLQEADLGMKRAPQFNTMNRGRRSMKIDLKNPEARETVLQLLKDADGLIEGFRPGVMERLGLGPEDCLAANPRLVYGRITGWGQDGPLSQQAGHDINYLAISGALHGIGRKGAPPAPPLNLLADMGGGGIYLAFGMVCALLETAKSGEGQVVDAAMVEGVSSLMTSVYGMRAAGQSDDRRGENHYDSGCPWYDSYETADGKYIAVGAIEARFYSSMIRLLGIDDPDLPKQNDRENWPELRRRFAVAIKGKTRQEWEDLIGEEDVCLAPVLTPDEAIEHPHLKARNAFVEINGIKQPAPAPRFSRTQAAIPGPVSNPGQDTQEALLDWGFSSTEIARLRASNTIG